MKYPQNTIIQSTQDEGAHVDGFLMNSKLIIINNK